MVILPIIALFIRPSGKYHCIEQGCRKSFDTMEEILIHLKYIHGYDHSELQSIKNNFYKYRKK